MENIIEQSRLRWIPAESLSRSFSRDRSIEFGKVPEPTEMRGCFISGDRNSGYSQSVSDRNGNLAEEDARLGDGVKTSAGYFV